MSANAELIVQFFVRPGNHAVTGKRSLDVPAEVGGRPQLLKFTVCLGGFRRFGIAAGDRQGLRPQFQVAVFGPESTDFRPVFVRQFGHAAQLGKPSPDFAQPQVVFLFWGHE